MQTLEMMGINKGANSVIALTNDDAINLSIVLSARALNERIKIISRVNKSNSKKKFEIAGVNETILFNDVTAFVASEYLGQPVAFEAIDGILLNRDFDVVIDEVEIPRNSKIFGKNINIIDFKNYSLTLLGIINLADLNEFILRCDSSQAYISVSLFLFWTINELLILHPKQDFLLDNGHILLKHYIASCFVVEQHRVIN